MNPGGSIKDRIGVSMIEEAERRGRTTARRTRSSKRRPAIPVSVSHWSAALKGYRADPGAPGQDEPGEDLQPARDGRRGRADALGRRASGHPEYYQDLGARLAREHGAFFINQFGNPDNPKAHETTTAPGDPRNRWSNASTRSSVGHRFERHDRRPHAGASSERLPSVEIVLADPRGLGARGVCTQRSHHAQGRLVAGRGHRRGFHPGHLRISRCARKRATAFPTA